jgi:hypothetical protein
MRRYSSTISVLQPGDLVRANPDFPYRWDVEEIKLGKVYEVFTTHSSNDFRPYAQLIGVHSSYPYEALELVQRAKK